MLRTSFRLLLLVCGMTVMGHANAQLAFGVPPQKNMRSALVTYSPLVDYLARITGQPVNMTVANGWFEYQAAIKAGSYDLLIAEPHIVGWMMDNLGFEPLVKFPSLLKYVVVVPADETGIAESNDLVSRIVCSRPPPSLGILLFLESFENAFQQPALKSVNGGDLNVLAGLYDGACDAALVSSSFVDNVLNQSQRSLLKVVLETRGMVNEALVSSERIPFEIKDRIIESLSRDPAGIAATERLREQSDISASSMVPANMLEYSGLAELLQTQSFGW